MSRQRRTTATLGRLIALLAAGVISLMTLAATVSAVSRPTSLNGVVEAAAPKGAASARRALGASDVCALRGGDAFRCTGDNPSGPLGDRVPADPRALSVGQVARPTTVAPPFIASSGATPSPNATPSPVIPPIAPSPASRPVAPGAQVNADLAGDWSVTYGSPSVVTISGSNGSYTVTAKSRIQVTGSSCYLPPGTLIATFSGSLGSYSGQHGLWYTSNCSFVRWDPMTLTLDGNKLTGVFSGISERPTFTKLNAGPPPFRESVPTPAQITLDPVIVAQTLAIVAGIVILVPFPAILFNRTLEENYPEIVGRVRRTRRRLGVRRRLAALVGSLLSWAGRQPRGSSPPAESQPIGPTPERGPDSVQTDPEQELEQESGGRFWRTPLGIVLFVLLSAVLYGFLDPTFGADLRSAAALGGLVAGLAVTLAAFCVPIAVTYRRGAIPFSVRALPGALAVGLACVLISRLTDVHPGYLYGLVVAVVVAGELSVAVEGRAMAMATGLTLVVAVVAWLGLWGVDLLVPAQGDPEPALIALQTALVMALVAGVELTVFGMVPLRFLPGEKVWRWNRRVWAALFAVGLVGFVHVLMNPRSGYLSDATTTPIVTIVVLLILFGLASVVFWAYFRFRSVPASPRVGS